MRTLKVLALFAVLALILVVGCTNPPPTPVPPTETPTPTPTPEPNRGYQVVGNQILDSSGLPHTFRGVSRPSLEWWRPEWGFDEHLTREDLALIKDWGANVIRFPLFQRSWRENGEYVQKVVQVVKWSEQLGLDVILDLHLSERGDKSYPIEELGEPPMPDLHSLGFWVSLSAMFKDDPNAIFELYSEPHDVSPEVWAYGGDTGVGYTSVGMQELIDAIRNGGAENLIIINGLDWGFNHKELPRLTGKNLVYGSHTYTNWNESNEESEWQSAFGFLSEDFPIILSSFGDIGADCAGRRVLDDLLKYAESINSSYVGWAWWVEGCEFPSLIQDWYGTPTASGEIVRKYLRLNP